MAIRRDCALALENGRVFACSRGQPEQSSNARPAVNKHCVIAVFALGLPGCLDAPPTYVAPQQIPPLVTKNLVEPPLNSIVNLEPDIPMEIVVPFRSEDLGEPVNAVAFLDLLPGGATGEFLGLFDAPASSFDDTTRSITGPVTNVGESGCHSVTLMVAHESKLQDILKFRGDQTAVERIIWWVNVTGSGDDKPLLEDCISQGATSGQDGSDE